MALIEINADLKRTAKALERIAHAMETLCTLYFGVPLERAAAPSDKDLRDEVSYTSDRQEIRQEIAAKLNISAEPEDEQTGA